jgi:hypothetical protein
MRSRWRRLMVVAWGLAICGAAGCGDARLELAAADALTAAADRMETVVAEYHGDVVRLDDSREQAVVEAFVQRVKANPTDEQVVAGHEAAFRSALSMIREDRAVEWRRHAAAAENAAAVREVADGLQRMGLESVSLQDEMRRYLSGWIEARRQSVASKAAASDKTVTACGAGKGVRP